MDQILLAASPKLKSYLVNLDDFEMGKCIGEGAFGKVYRGLHRPTQRDCAVKILIVQKLEGRDKLDFIREISVLAECNDFCLLPFIGWSAAPTYSIITEFVSNGSLFNALRKKEGSPNLTPTNKTIIMYGIAYGMLFLHQKGVIHRDLKSLNILLDENLYPKVCDFGLSRIVGEEQALMTQDIGTPHWMAPELFESTDYTNKVDVYAYGMLLWELITGASPYRGKTAIQIAVAVCQHQERPALPNTISHDMRRFIDACWHQYPKKRPTFSKIVKVFEKKGVYFPDTDMNLVDLFLERIREFNNPGIPLSKIPNMPLSKIPNSSMNSQLPVSSRLSSQPKSRSSRSGSISENNINLILKIDDPNYKTNFKNILNLLKPDNILDFYRALIPIFNNNNNTSDLILTFLLKQLYILILNNSNYLDIFIKSELFLSLPNNRRSTASDILNILYLIFSKNPLYFNDKIIEYFSPLTDLFPNKVLKILHMLSLQLNNLSNNWIIFNSILNLSPRFLTGSSSIQYIQLLWMLMSYFPQFIQEKFSEVQSILINSLNQNSIPLAEISFSLLCILSQSNILVPNEIIHKCLITQGFENSALSYLLFHRTIFQPDEQIINDLINNSNKQISLLLLLSFSSKIENYNFFFPNNEGKWLIDGRMNFQNSFKILLNFFKFSQLILFLIKIPQFNNWLSSILEFQIEIYFDFSSILIYKLINSQDFILQLKSVNFFKIYIDFLIKIQTESIILTSLYSIDSLLRKYYIDEFNFLIPFLIKLLSKVDNLTLPALSTLTCLSQHKESLLFIKQYNELTLIINHYEQFNTFKPYIDILKSNLN